MVIIIPICLTRFLVVSEKSVVILERLGKFNSILKPGLHFIPLLGIIYVNKGSLSLKLRNLTLNIETKTRDNVFVKLIVTLQIKVSENNEYKAFYGSENPKDIIESFFLDRVRSEVPKYDLDILFHSKNTLADVIKEEEKRVFNLGFEIENICIVDIIPNQEVKDSMNKINAALRERVASEEKGEAEKILIIKKAQAEAEANILRGQGIAGQRHAVLKGFTDSVNDFNESIDNSLREHIKLDDICNFILLVQYFDTLKEISHSSKHSTLFVPYNKYDEIYKFSNIRRNLKNTDLI